MQNSLGQNSCLICIRPFEPPADPDERFAEICPVCKQKMNYHLLRLQSPVDYSKLDEYGYPMGWPKCPCGKPTLDGHLTCGDVRCSEFAARR